MTGPHLVQEPGAQIRPAPKQVLQRKQWGGEGVWAGAGSDLHSAGSPALFVGFQISGAKAFQESARTGTWRHHQMLLRVWSSSAPFYASLQQLFPCTDGVMGMGF